MRAVLANVNFVWLGVVLAVGLLPASPVAAASVTCTPFSYVAGDLSCTNSGTINTTGTDGFDIPATGGNATGTNNGSITTLGDRTAGMFTFSDTANAVSTNNGSIVVIGSGVAGLATEAALNATANNFGSINVTDTGFSFGSSVGMFTAALNATANNYGTINVTGTAYMAGMLTGRIPI